MKNIKSMKALLLAVLMVLSVTLFAACGGESGGSNTQSAEAAYKVTVQDALGNPYTANIAVKFLKDGQQAAMQMVNESGVAEKTMTRDNYTVELQFTDPNANYRINTEDLTLTADKTELTVVLSMPLGDKSFTLYDDVVAYYVTAGCTDVTLNAEGRSFYIFSIEQAGKYEFSLAGSDAAIGYYGERHFVQETCPIEVKDNKFQMSFSQDMLGASPVIGIDAGEGNAVLCINRIGEPDWTIEQEPWHYYQPTVTVNPYTLPAGAKLNKFDIKSADGYNLVLNENDGFYHLDSADGPLVLALLAKDKLEKPEYVDTFEQIMENYGPCRYIYDSEGNFVRKEAYYDCLAKYIENCDEAYGVYPLTEDLAYIIQQTGAQQRWYQEDSPGYLFKNSNGEKIPGINSEISWLFMCRYIG